MQLPATPFGIMAIDRHLPVGRLPTGAMHDPQAPEPNTGTSAARRRSRPMRWRGGPA